MKKGKEFQSFLTSSCQQSEAVLEDKELQNFMTVLETQVLLQTIPQYKRGELSADLSKIPSTQTGGRLYVFVSFSLGEKALLNLAYDAKQFGATLVLRGFKDGSYLKTAQALQHIIQETGQGFVIDPELFSLFAVTAVPTYVLSRPFQFNAPGVTQIPLHDRLQGHVSVSYVLGVFAKEGSLKEEASSFLENTSLERGNLK
ncbi:MAG: type-F conjugative transfer system pilin assembly protein TrbC [Alphaproteobacteria bacterium]|nr:type-F conjugative transfer system pilin assembly protein TrbC [Alphaproteobacteria bacterium]